MTNENKIALLEMRKAILASRVGKDNKAIIHKIERRIAKLK